MAIYLVQHGISLDEAVDPERGLSEAGERDVIKIAELARSYNIPVTKIVHSGKKRAAQTADIFDHYLQPKYGVLQQAGMAPMNDVTIFARQLQADSNTMYVGHQPFMGKLTGYLTAGDEAKAVFAFQNGGVVCLDKGVGDEFWQIRWALMGEIG